MVGQARLVRALAALALVASACSGSPDERPTVDAPVAQAPPPPSAPPCTPARLEERAARVLLVGLPETTSPADPLVEEVLDVGVGGVLVTHANVQNFPQAEALVTALRSRFKGPLLVAADEEPGRVRTLEALYGRTPSARRMGAERTVEEVEQIGRAHV
jgi:beta-N-acetylhexosaminidase